jgi:hypothetical protein
MIATSSALDPAGANLLDEVFLQRPVLVETAVVEA